MKNIRNPANNILKFTYHSYALNIYIGIMKKKIIEQNIFQNGYELNRIISMPLIFRYAKSINLSFNNNNNVLIIMMYDRKI